MINITGARPEIIISTLVQICTMYYNYVRMCRRIKVADEYDLGHSEVEMQLRRGHRLHSVGNIANENNRTINLTFDGVFLASYLRVGV